MTPFTLRRLSAVSLLLASIPTLAAERPAGPLAAQGALVFSDDFSHAELGKNWKVGIPAYSIEDGVLKGWQERDDHGSSLGATIPLTDGNAIVELRFQMDGANSLNINLDDKTYPGVHAGHISRVVLRANRVTLYDDKEGVMRNDIYELRKSTDPARKAQGDKLAEGRTVNFPIKLQPGKWYKLGIEIVGDQLRVTLDDQEIGYLKSSGLTHPRKSDLRIGVWGKSARVDDLKIWSVAAAPRTTTP